MDLQLVSSYFTVRSTEFFYSVGRQYVKIATQIYREGERELDGLRGESWTVGRLMGVSDSKQFTCNASKDNLSWEGTVWSLGYRFGTVKHVSTIK